MAGINCSLLDVGGDIGIHQNINTAPETFLSIITPFREDIGVAVECMFTPLLHKDAVESNAYPHQKTVSTLLRITSKGHSWIDPGDDIDLTAIPLWVRVG